MQKKVQHNPTVLVCPLNWGLGHAARCIPIIKSLQQKNCDVIVAADKHVLHFLCSEFPDIKTIRLKGMLIKYGKKANWPLFFIFKLPKLLLCIFKEHAAIKKVVKKYNIDVVISDNRFGLFGSSAYSIYITHQLAIKLPAITSIFEGWVNRIHRFFIKKFDECWVPDFENGLTLAGELSHPSKAIRNVTYIGPLSRFASCNNHDNWEKRYDIAVILSGPEPQRSILENMAIAQLKTTNYKAIIVQGKPEYKQNKVLSGNIQLASIMNSEQLYKTMMQSDVILCRSGYTSIMDLLATGKRAILIPTPGQSEQEYLAQLHHTRNFFVKSSQNALNINEIMLKIAFYNSHKIEFPANLLAQTIENLISKYN